jgi:5-methyltetrahydrofolate--homocysteine methyltransferase
MVQAQNLVEADYRGSRFADHGADLKGNADILNLTQPELVAGLHREYFEAGADIIETNTFNATAIGRPITGPRIWSTRSISTAPASPAPLPRR